MCWAAYGKVHHLKNKDGLSLLTHISTVKIVFMVATKFVLQVFSNACWLSNNTPLPPEYCSTNLISASSPLSNSIRYFIDPYGIIAWSTVAIVTLICLRKGKNYWQLMAAREGKVIFFRGVFTVGWPCPRGWLHSHETMHSTILTK